MSTSALLHNNNKLLLVSMAMESNRGSNSYFCKARGKTRRKIPKSDISYLLFVLGFGCGGRGITIECF